MSKVGSSLPTKNQVNEVIEWLNYSKNGKKYYLFAFIWAYLIIRLLFADIDLLFLQEQFHFQIGKYVLGRFLVVILILLILWVKIGNKSFWLNVGLFVLFPFYPALFFIFRYFIWRLPEKIIRKKKYYLLLAYIDTLIFFIVKFKTTMLKMIMMVFGIFGAAYFDSYCLIIPFIIFAFLQASHLIGKYDEISEPVRLFQVNVKKIKLNFSEENFNKQLESLSKDKKTPKEIKMSQMEYFLLVDAFSKMLNQRVDDVLSSRSYFKNFALKALHSLILSIFLFSGLNYCLFKFDSANYSFNGEARYFNFLFYSFFTIFPDGVDIEPVSTMAKSIKMLGVLIGVAINIVVLIVYATVINDKYKENLGELNAVTKEYSADISAYFQKKYNKDMIEGYKWLKSTGSSITEFLEQLSKLISKK